MRKAVKGAGHDHGRLQGGQVAERRGWRCGSPRKRPPLLLEPPPPPPPAASPDPVPVAFPGPGPGGGRGWRSAPNAEGRRTGLCWRGRRGAPRSASRSSSSSSRAGGGAARMVRAGGAGPSGARAAEPRVPQRRRGWPESSRGGARRLRGAWQEAAAPGRVRAARGRGRRRHQHVAPSRFRRATAPRGRGRPPGRVRAALFPRGPGTPWEK